MKLKEQILRDTPFIPLYKFALEDRNIQEALLLSFLIDADSFAATRLAEDWEYFQCTDSFIQSQTNLSSPTIKKYLDKLMNEGIIFIRIIRLEFTQQRFIKLNNTKLIQMYYDYNNKEKNIKNIKEDKTINLTDLKTI